MSISRDALTNPAAYATCRRMGHHWQPDGRCSCCRARLDLHDVRPYQSANGPLGGVPMGQATPVRPAPAPVRTPTDGDLTTALETLLSVGLHEIADPSCSGEPDHARTHAKAVELARSPLAHEMVEAAARRTTGADGLLGVANIMRRHTHQGVWAMSRFAGPDPSADCLLCRALVDAGVLTLDDIGAGTREAILQGPTEGPSCATCHHPIHHGPLACDVGMATTGGLCCCVDLAPVGVTP